MTVAPQPDPLDGERRTAQEALERAVRDGRLTLDEFTDRCGQVWAATAPADIERTVADLPVQVVGGATAARSTLVSLIGDIRRRDRWSLRRRTNILQVIGDVELDLRGAVITDDDAIEIGVFKLIGDVEVTVPDGVEAELRGITLLGDRRIDLAAVPRIPGTPVVRVRCFHLSVTQSCAAPAEHFWTTTRDDRRITRLGWTPQYSRACP